jgi:hypothetical protein
MTAVFHALKLRVFEPIQRALAINPKYVVPVFSLALGYRVDGEFTQHGKDFTQSDDIVAQRKLVGGHIAFGGSHTKSLYYNAMFFLRFNLPFGLFIGIRWAGKDPYSKEFAQAGIGTKLNGDFALTLRVQSDASAAGGTTGPNVGQAIGWNQGEK